ncbi:MAG: single-stranded DNA-binding protein [Roseiarcus sp.]|jgi:single-strand DNA-binding protein
MAALNKAMLIGNLGKDPAIRVTNSGGKVATFSIATSESWKDKATGERKERTEWHNVVVFNEGLLGIAEQYLKKGSRCYVEGELRTRKWTDQAGVEKYTTEIVLAQYRGALLLLDKADRPPPNEGDYGATRSAPRAAAPASGPSAGGDLDDDIPF